PSQAEACISKRQYSKETQNNNMNKTKRRNSNSNEFQRFFKEHKQFCGVVDPINNIVVKSPYNKTVVFYK
ncbi:MAG: hypothetical protein J6F33_13735, partial [Acidaminococcaceae bacterium]|nr:hypothetical protein [Acidaminococcaceae bacterium]